MSVFTVENIFRTFSRFPPNFKETTSLPLGRAAFTFHKFGFFYQNQLNLTFHPPCSLSASRSQGSSLSRDAQTSLSLAAPSNSQGKYWGLPRLARRQSLQYLHLIQEAPWKPVSWLYQDGLYSEFIILSLRSLQTPCKPQHTSASLLGVATQTLLLLLFYVPFKKLHVDYLRILSWICCVAGRMRMHMQDSRRRSKLKTAALFPEKLHVKYKIKLKNRSERRWLY